MVINCIRDCGNHKNLFYSPGNDRALTVPNMRVGGEFVCNSTKASPKFPQREAGQGGVHVLGETCVVLAAIQRFLQPWQALPRQSLGGGHLHFSIFRSLLGRGKVGGSFLGGLGDVWGMMCMPRVWAFPFMTYGQARIGAAKDGRGSVAAGRGALRCLLTAPQGGDKVVLLHVESTMNDSVFQ